MVEIVVHKPKSKIFRRLAANAKIPKEFLVPGRTYDYDSYPAESSYHAKKHTRIEWEDIILNSPEEQFLRITEFLNVVGDTVIFKQLVTDYCQRNQELLKELNNA